MYTRSHQSQRTRWLIALFTLTCLWGCHQTSSVPPKVKEQLVNLASKDATTRWKAAKTLGRMGPKAAQAADALLKALHDPHWLVRGQAARAIPKLGKEALPAIRKALAKRHYTNRRDGSSAMAQLVRRMQSVLLPALRKRAKRHHGSARTWALSAMTLAGPATLPIFAGLMREKENDLRSSTARVYPALGNIAHLGIKTLATHLRDTDASVQQQVLRSILAIGTKDPNIHKQVQQLFSRSTDVRVKIEAAKALGQWKANAPKVVEGILEILTSPTALSYFHYQLLAPLGQLTKQLPHTQKAQRKRAIDVLIQFVQHRLPSLRLKAAQALVHIGAKARQSVPTLVSLYQKKTHLRPFLLRGFRQMLDLSIIRQLAFQTSPVLRTIAAQCIPRHATSKPAEPLVKALLTDRSPTVQRVMLKALAERWKKQPPKGHKQLQVWLYTQATTSKNPAVRAAALTAASYLPTKPSTTTPKPTPTPTTKPTSKAASMPTSKAAPKPAPSKLPASPSWHDVLHRGLQGPPAVATAAAKALQRVPQLSTALWLAMERAIQRAKTPKTLAALFTTLRKRATKRTTFAPPTFQMLLGHTQHSDVTVRIAACRALGHNTIVDNSSKRAQSLIKLLGRIRNDSVADVAREASVSLGKLLKTQKARATGQRMIQSIAKSMLAHDATALQLRGIDMLSRLPHPQQKAHVSRLKHLATQGTKRRIRSKATELLLAHNIPTAFWSKLLADREAGVRLHALRALQRRAPKIDAAIPGLIALVWARENLTESRAIALLGQCKAKQAIPAIRDRLTAYQWSTRAHAATALGQLDRKSISVRKALQQTTRDPHPKVRQAAQKALSATP